MRVSSIACYSVLFAISSVVAFGCGGSGDGGLEARGQQAAKHFTAAVELEGRGQLEEAIAEYDEVVRLTPRDVVAYSNRGTIYDNLGQYQQAIESYNLAIGVNPNFNVLYTNRSMAYYGLGEYELALEDLNRFIEHEPNNPDGYVGRAMVYTQLGRDTEARNDAIQAVELGVDPVQVEARIEAIKSQR
jgi:Flp pilus assembly protein TadD